MKDTFRQYWGVLFLSVVALSFIAGQAFLTSSREEGVKEIYFADRMTEAHRILIDEYNRLHEGEVKVVPIDFPNPDFTTNERKEILARSLRGGGDNIDLFAVDVIWVQRFERWSESLDPYFTPEELLAISPEALRVCFKDGKLVAIPFGTVRGVLWYREDLVRSLPGGKEFIDEVMRGITWDRFAEFGRSVSSGAPFYIFPAAEYEGLLCSFTEILLSRRKDYFDVHGFEFVTPEAKEALQLLVDLVHKYGVSPASVTTMTEVQSYEHFISRDALFLRGWTIFDKDFSIGAEKEKFIRMAPLPYLDGGERASTIGGWNLMVSRFSSKKQEAIDFVKFLLSKESQELIYRKGGFSPVIRALYEDPAYQNKLPELVEINRKLQHGVNRPSHEKYTKYSDILAHYISLAIRGKISVDDALLYATNGIGSEKILFEQVDVVRVSN